MEAGQGPGAADQLDQVLYGVAEGLRVAGDPVARDPARQGGPLLVALGAEERSIDSRALRRGRRGQTLGELEQLFPRVERERRRRAPVVDTHCHLDSCKPPDERARRAARAKRGSSASRRWAWTTPSIERALAAADSYDEVFAIVGRHPNEATGFDPTRDIEPIERAAAHPRVRAIGETGLDYFRDYAPHDDQRRAFEAQIDLAAPARPAARDPHPRGGGGHVRDAARPRRRLTVIMHCFSAPGRLDECVERGYCCSFAGNVTYPKATDLQQAARDVPDDLLLVETDSPYLAPQPVRGKPQRAGERRSHRRVRRGAARRRLRAARRYGRAQRRARLRLVSDAAEPEPTGPRRPACAACASSTSGPTASSARTS